ncbi:MAG: hypothetical protein IKG21_10360 [Atopobiaceae bacterium]|nr:hypothetical protein [Atopobiaceae bacterium]
MVLYWPDRKVALDIVDDPQRRPFEAEDAEDWNVLRVTVSDLHRERFARIMHRLCFLLGVAPNDAAAVATFGLLRRGAR